MSENIKNFDPIWEKKYADGHVQLYPWDLVVSFIFCYFPKNLLKKDIKVLELGFGTGSNIWFAAREGFQVYGVEASKTAVLFAKKRFELDSLEGDLRHGNFTELPFSDNYFDLVIDRCSLVCVGNNDQKKAINETRRVLRQGGSFLHNIYGKNHSSYLSGEEDKDGLTSNIVHGTLVVNGKLCFSSRSDIFEKFKIGWKLKQIERRENTETLNLNNNIHEEWVVIAQKI